MATHPLPLELAQKLAYLDRLPEWEALLEYLRYREGQLHSRLGVLNERDSDGLIAKVAMISKGGELEMALLRGLPELCRSICEDESRKAEAKK